LNDSDYHVRALAMVKISGFTGKENLDDLHKVLKLGSRDEKIEILRTLTADSENLRDDLASFVVMALSDKHDQVVVEALKLASKLENPIVFDAIVAKLKTEKHHVRCEIAKTLGKIGGEKSIEVLLSLLADKNYQVRLTAEKTLTLLHSSKTLKSVQELKLTLMTVKLAGTMQGKLKALKEIRTAKLNFTIPLMEKLVSDEFKSVRLEAVKTLSVLNKSEAMSAIAKFLEDKFWDVRKEAVLALGKFAEKKSLEYLELALNDENTNVRVAAAETIELVKMRLARLGR
jgi:HEAT repeat protein